jgi:hypothetical protein
MEKIKLGFKRKIQEKEKLLFDSPYLVMGKKPEEKHRVNKFWLKGEGVVDLLRFVANTDAGERNKLSWVFDANDEDAPFYLVNISESEAEVDPTINVNLTLDFNNKSLAYRLQKEYELDPLEEHYFALTEATIEGFPAVALDLVFPIDEDKGREEAKELNLEEEEHVMEARADDAELKSII